MFGLRSAKNEATEKFRRAKDKLEATVADADECITRIQQRASDTSTEPQIHPMRRMSDYAQRR